MTKRTFCFVLASALMVSASVPLTAGELAGTSMPESIDVAGESLVLNGMGLRKKSIIKVYVAGLYLPEKQNSAESILAADTARRTVMEMRFGVSAKKMCGAWEEGLENNTVDASAEVRSDFETLCSYMDDLEKGDNMTITYVPGEGTEVTINGSSKGTIAGKDFADAMFACWIGPKPPGAAFKKGLLGG